MVGCAMTLLIAPANAAIIAATNFDGRTLPSPNTADNLNWTVNGVADPGTMSAFTFGGTAQSLFNGTLLTENMFAPALNVGNAGNDETRSWTTTISLEVLSGFFVSMESVSFDYWAVNGGQAQNVTRNSDFIVTLLDPASDAIETVSIFDVFNGANPGVGTPVLLSFSSPIALSAPGVYTLRIRAGDIDDNETGNHTGIDNLSINGTVIPEPGTALLGLAGLGLMLRRRR